MSESLKVDYDDIFDTKLFRILKCDLTGFFKNKYVAKLLLFCEWDFCLRDVLMTIFLIIFLEFSILNDASLSQ